MESSNEPESLSLYDTVGIHHALDDLLIATLTKKKKKAATAAIPRPGEEASAPSESSEKISSLLPLKERTALIDLRIVLSTIAVALAVWLYFKGRQAPFVAFVAGAVAYFVLDGIIEVLNRFYIGNCILWTRAVRKLPDLQFLTDMPKFSSVYTITARWDDGEVVADIDTTEVLDTEGHLVKVEFVKRVINLLKKVEAEATQQLEEKKEAAKKERRAQKAQKAQKPHAE